MGWGILPPPHRNFYPNNSRNFGYLEQIGRAKHHFSRPQYLPAFNSPKRRSEKT